MKAYNYGLTSLPTSNSPSRANEIPTIDVDEGRVTIKIISGKSHGVESVKELAYTPVWYFDITLRPSGQLIQALPKGWNAFAYILRGSASCDVGDDATIVGQYHIVVFDLEGDSVSIKAEGEARVILVAGQPLDQEVVQYGPFVLGSEEQVEQAMVDFQRCRNGFERARGWKSRVGRGLVR